MNDAIKVTLEKDVYVILAGSRIQLERLEIGSDLDDPKPEMCADFWTPSEASFETCHVSAPGMGTPPSGLLVEVSRVPCPGRVPAGQKKAHAHLIPARQEESEKILKYLQSCASRLTRKTP
jgi:hypothetical protein